ncbi:MAG: TonB family protein, partial [Bacteroidota bacterium]|nr:TonB family protein [Bacteroidota bacterium]
KVEIKVNKLGKVVSASITKGTNITDQKLQKQALNAALKSTFEPDPKAPEVQKGTITYNFIRIN